MSNSNEEYRKEEILIIDDTKVECVLGFLSIGDHIPSIEMDLCGFTLGIIESFCEGKENEFQPDPKDFKIYFLKEMNKRIKSKEANNINSKAHGITAIVNEEKIGLVINRKYNDNKSEGRLSISFTLSPTIKDIKDGVSERKNRYLNPYGSVLTMGSYMTL